MSEKRVIMGVKPHEESVDSWVESRTVVPIRHTKRLTIEISGTLHREIKVQCATRGTKIIDEITELLIEKYGVK